jgi:very-short-patch-repair endonuclease
VKKSDAKDNKISRHLSLFDVHSELVKEWHPTKNGILVPTSVTYGSGEKVWWVCKNGHEWQAKILNRSHGTGCPYCSGNAVYKGNSLSTVNPALASDWHPTLNNQLTPDDVTAGSNRKIWWVCDKGHVWQALVSERNRGTGCPYCSRNLVSDDNCLEIVNPRLAKEWNVKKNGSMLPSSVAANSSKKVWWICNKGHEWQAKVADRNRGRRCPQCNSQTSQLELRVFTEMKYLFGNIDHRKKIKKLECDIYIPNIKVAIEVDAFHWHKDKYDYDRTKEVLLKGNGVTLFRVREHGLRRTSQNNIFFSRKDGTFTILKRILNRILAKTELQHGILNRINEYLQHGQIANEDEYLKLLDMLPSPLPGYSLMDLNRKLTSEWHPTKNGSLLPSDVSVSSNKKVWWKCSRDHEWKTTVSHRNSGCQCPYCSGHAVHEGNSLSTVNPKLAKEWHTQKNRSLSPKDVTANSSRKVWWVCGKGHEWMALISNRNAGAGCPFCSGRLANDKNSLKAINPTLAGEWHTLKNGAITPKDVTVNSSKKIWWICKEGHEWQARVSDRNRGSKCPYCAGRAVSQNNCLSTKRPDVAKEWHFKKNKHLTPDDVSFASHNKVWWLCDKGHEWQATVKNRSYGAGCPYCQGRRK